MSDMWPRWDRNEGQRGVIYCLLANYSLIDSDLMKGVTDKHFTDPVMRDHYKVIITNGDIPVELLAACSEDPFFPNLFGVYVRKLKTQWMDHCKKAGTEKVQVLLDEGKTKEANEVMQKLESISIDDEWIDFTEGYREIYKEKQKEMEGGITASIRTGFLTLDKYTGGMHKGQLWVVGGGVGHGKTTLAVQIAKNVAKQGKKVGVFSLEMTRRSVLERFSCSMAQVDYIKYVNNEITHNQNAQVHNEMHSLSSLGILFYDNPSATPETLLSASQDKGFDLIIIDHLHRVKHRSQSSLNEKAFEVANTSKTIARVNDCTVMLIGQFSREHSKRVDGDGNKGRPNMNDFRDSGMIEAEADTILLLYRPSEYDENKPVEKAEWIIPKLRFGQSGAFPMRWGGLKGWQDLDKYRE